MPAITEKELIEDIKKADFKSVYLIYGNEDYLKKYYSSAIIKKAVTDFEDLNLHRFDSSVKVDDIIAAADAIPMMSDYSCVSVCDYNFASADETEVEKLVDLISDMPEGCVLLLRLEQLSITPSKSAKAKKVFDAVKKYGALVELNLREEADLVRMVTKRAASRSVNLQPTGARYLIRVCGSDITNLFSEVDKLCDFVGKDGIITEKEIDALAVKTPDEKAYRLINAVCARDVERVYTMLADLAAQCVDSIAIIAALSSAYVDMYRAKVAESEGKNAESIGADFGYGKNAFKLKYASQNARKMSVFTLRKALNILRETDIALKSTQLDPRLLVDKTVMQLIQLAGER
ncbi:MAG: DNA polymerase III subunit delta [Clostridia bacterium]|nr:DNA polymerase III subunit delta [Clostridia bacterium]